MQLAFYQRICSFAIWHVHVAYPSGFIALPTLKRMRVPSLVTCHGEDVQKLQEIGYGTRLDPVVEQKISKTLLGFDKVIAISESIRTELLSLGVLPEKIRNIPNGVETSRFKNLHVERNALRAAMGWPSDKKRVQIHPGNNQESCSRSS